MRMSTRKQARGEPTRHEPPDLLFDGLSTRRTSRLPAPVQSTLSTWRTVKAATTRAGSDFPPSSGLRACLRREDRLFFGQRAANRLRRAQRSTAANQRADLAAVRARIQRRKQYLCRRAMCAGSCRRRAFRLWLVAILSSSAFGGWDRRNGSRVRGHIAACGGRRRRKAGAGTSLGKCPQLPCSHFKFRACRLTVMAIHDRPRFKPMPNNAWLRSL
jgi:hypothetical protein